MFKLFQALLICLTTSNSCPECTYLLNPDSVQKPFKFILDPLKNNPIFYRPVDLITVPHNDDYLLLAQQNGKILLIDTQGKNKPKCILDISTLIFTRNNEEGLLSIALDPNFQKNNKLFAWYSAKNPRRSILSSFEIDIESENLKAENLKSLRIILEVKQPFGNHNGGKILFGNDRKLYLSIGDGGSANDPFNHGQNLQTLLGTIIRIDVSNSSDFSPYEIPEDNPFVNAQSAKDEIWAYGLRNVWRMTFDKKGNLWAADVGQNKIEEVNLITKGGNYGWNLREGSSIFKENKTSKTKSLISPIIEYTRADGSSITGGIVYEGNEFLEIQEHYLYADYYSGTIWALDTKNIKKKTVLKKPGLMITNFMADNKNNIWICTFNEKFPKKGRIAKLIKGN